MVGIQKRKSNASKVWALVSTFGFVILFAFIASLFARGYRINGTTRTLEASGLLVVKSEPDGAQVFVDGKVVGVTNDSFGLVPDIYDLNVTKDGYTAWSKRVQIQKGEVTEVTANLFKQAPSLSAITLSGAFQPVPSRDFTKLAYGVPLNLQDNGNTKSGLWVMETLNLPLGFSREPRRITDGNLEGAVWTWSPDGRELLLTTQTGSFLLDAGSFTPQNQRVNVASQLDLISEKWEEELQKKEAARRKKLPDEVNFMLDKVSGDIIFSPDEEMVLYTATQSTTLKDDLITPLPGRSTQKQIRDIESNHIYIYDIKEDRNYLIHDELSNLQITGGANDPDATRRLVWFPTSRHVVFASENSIIIMDYDGTNKQSVYSGSFITPHAFPTLGTDRLMVLTNLGASDTPANIYSLTIK